MAARFGLVISSKDGDACANPIESINYVPLMESAVLKVGKRDVVMVGFL